MSIVSPPIPKVTAIITTFNRVNFVPLAIESVLTQTMGNFELIVLDNSSNDGTPEVIARFNDTRLRYHRHEAMGISEQRNLGVSMALSEYIAFLDDDDVWLPNKLAVQLNAMEQSGGEAALVYGGFRFYDDTGRRWGEHLPTLTGSVLSGLLWARDPFSGSASNPLVSRRCALTVGCYDNNVKVGEDWELYLRLAQRYEVVGVQEVVLEIRQHTGPRLGQRVDAALSTERHVYRCFRGSMKPNLRSRYLQRIGGKYVRLGNRRRGRKLLVAALKLHPLNLFAWAQILLSGFESQTYLRFHKLYHKYLRAR